MGPGLRPLAIRDRPPCSSLVMSSTPGSWVALEGQVGAADVGGGVDAEEGWGGVGIGGGGDFGEGALDVEAAALLAIDQAEDPGDVHAGIASGFDGGDGGDAGGADAVDADEGGAGVGEGFGAA